jgi:hypothetical protein
MINWFLYYLHFRWISIYLGRNDSWSSFRFNIYEMIGFLRESKLEYSLHGKAIFDGNKLEYDSFIKEFQITDRLVWDIYYGFINGTYNVSDPIGNRQRSPRPKKKLNKNIQIILILYSRL